MKNFILIIISLFTPITIFTQNSEPTTHLFSIDGQQVTPNPDYSWFRQNKMLFGWQWGGGRKMTEALLMSQVHGTSPVWNGTCWVDADTTGISDSLDDILMVPTISNWHYWIFSPLLSMSFKYEPTLFITNPGYDTVRPNDPSNAIFGFKHIQGIISNNPADVNYNRLVLKPNLHTGDTVLRDPWICNGLMYLGDGNDANDNYQKGPPIYFYDLMCNSQYANPYVNSVRNLDWNGREMYFTINLRRLASVGIQDNTNVLAIKLPYVLTDSTTGFINFSQLPSSVPNDTLQMLYNRGIARKTVNVSPTNTLYITRNMLPVGNDRDITISAKFICDGHPEAPIYHNPHFKPGIPNHIPIDSLKIEVVYLGGDSIAIDWCKFECKVAQDLSRGLYDTALVWNAQHAFDVFSQQNFKTKGIRPLRFYTIDEHGDPWIWGSYRYANKLIGNICMTEMNPIYPNLFNYYVNPPNYLESLNFIGVPPYVPQGALRDPNYGGNIPSYRVLGYSWGYRLYGWADTLHSDYETYFTEGYCGRPNLLAWLRDTANITDYLDYIGRSSGYQNSIEFMKYSNFFNPIQNGFIYQNKCWWAQNTVGGDWHFQIVNGDTFAVVFRSERPGEEIRNWLWSTLIMGCKGFMLDRDESKPRYPHENNGWTAMGYGNSQDYYDQYNLNRLDDMSFIRSDSVGSDFLDLNNDYSLLQHYVNTHFVDTCMHVDSNRIYIGRRSLRCETRKVFETVRASDSIMMRLRLACWYGKGFKIWYNQDTARFVKADTIMKKFISLDPSYIKVRPLGRTKLVWGGDEYYYMNYYEPWDSIFLDITILRDSADHGFTGDHWTLGVQNRRTDPLIYSIDSVSGGGMDSSMKFYSTAEISII